MGVAYKKAVEKYGVYGGLGMPHGIDGQTDDQIVIRPHFIFLIFVSFLFLLFSSTFHFSLIFF